MNDSWLYQLNGTPCARPVTADELCALRELRVIGMNTLVRCDGVTGGWVTLEEVWGNPIPTMPDQATLARLSANASSTAAPRPSAPPRRPVPAAPAAPEASLIPPDSSWAGAASTLLSRPAAPAVVPAPRPVPVPPPRRPGGRQVAPAGPSVSGSAAVTAPPQAVRPVAGRGTGGAASAGTPATWAGGAGPVRRAGAASATTPVPRRRGARRWPAVVALMMLLLGAAGAGFVWWRDVSGRAAEAASVVPPPDPFAAELSAVVVKAGAGGWAGLGAYDRLLRRFPGRAGEVLPHLNNLLQATATTLAGMNVAEFVSATNALGLAAESGSVAAMRLLVRGYAQLGEDGRQRDWRARVVARLQPELDGLVSDYATSNVGSTLQAYGAFRARNPELEPSVLSNACAALNDLARGDVTPDVFQEQRGLLEQVAEAGCAEASRLLGDRLVAVTPLVAHGHYVKAARGGSAVAMYQLGNMEARGMAPQGTNFAQAAEWYERAAAAGHWGAQLELAKLLLSFHALPGLERRAREQRGVALLETICRVPDGSRVSVSDRQVHGLAMIKLGSIWAFGLYGQTGRWPEGVALLERALRNGHKEAHLPMGIHLTGIRLPGRSSYGATNFVAGLEHFEKGAQLADRSIATNCLEMLAHFFRDADPGRSRQYRDRARNLSGQAP